MAKTVDFFKCYNPKISALRLELPRAFSLQLQEALPERAFLRDCYTNIWPVKMAKFENDWFFCDGWEKFVEDNSLEFGDIFVFRYDGDNLFDIKLLGLSCCDKEGFQHFNTRVENENQEDSDAQVEQVAHGRKHQRHLDPYGSDIFSSGLAVWPRNPYFVTKTRTYRRNDFYIPKETIKDFHLDNLPQEMFLIDPEGRQFQTKLTTWKDGRVWYNGGWKSLCALNSVRGKDTCICEFVGGRLHVQVVRGNN